MDGSWSILEIERVDSQEPLPFPETVSTPFLSVQRGQTITISQGVAYAEHSSQPLYSVWMPGVANQRYVNVADGRVWMFDMLFEHYQSCGTRCQIRAAFGAVDQDTLDGTVEVQYLSSCPGPAILRPDPNGRFRVRLGRVGD